MQIDKRTNDEVRKIINGETPLPEGGDLKALIYRLEKVQDYDTALQVLARASERDPKDPWLLEQVALFTAELVIAGAKVVPGFGELEALVRELKGQLEFGKTRKLLLRATDHREQPAEETAAEEVLRHTWLVQQLALCTYKDEELLPRERFVEALTLLESIGLLEPDQAVAAGKVEKGSIPETLALGGAVYKRKWEQDGQHEHLYHALEFYRSAWEWDPETDMGYGGVNAAYVLDVLAARAKTVAVRAGKTPEQAEMVAEIEGLRAQARKLREKIKQVLVKVAGDKLSKENRNLEQEYWYLVTMAEVHFGLREYDDAGQWLSKARRAPAKAWEHQTTFTQLVSLARLQGCDSPAEGIDPKAWEAPWRALRELMGEETEPALSGFRGKVGLALSGGGFRASLFHIGVLARLAEMDVLRSVEALSTVSGGSIVGALYYLEIQQLLEKKDDKDITRADYVALVQRVLERFLAGVQKNLRTRVLASFGRNLKMIFAKEYSRSHRLGELYESELYSMVGGERAEKHEAERAMQELMVEPVKDERFIPKFSNWKRRAKVPVLLLNATSLNSGHSWQFTARWMGEPPDSMGTEIDVNERYRRLWYDQAPKEDHKKYRLGYAVAASACVPGLFEPLALEGLYPGATVRLVDGGVHDNQGVAGLLGESCTLVLCSDASGQMEDKKQPSDSLVGVPLRANSVLMDRVREAEFQDLRARVDSRALQGLFFIHLKKDLDTLPIDWLECQDPTVPPARTFCTTAYKVDKELQRKLAAIRTDLDSFTEVEAYSLMLSGYLMTEEEFRVLDRQHKRDGEPGTWGDFDVYAPRGVWRFLDLENLIRQPSDSSDARRAELGRQLDVGASLFFKAWKLSPKLRQVTWFGAAAAALLLVWLVYISWGMEIVPIRVTVGGVVVALVALVAGTVFPVITWLHPQDQMQSLAKKAVVAVVGYVVANIHLKFFDPWFLRLGKLDRLLKLE